MRSVGTPRLSTASVAAAAKPAEPHTKRVAAAVAVDIAAYPLAKVLGDSGWMEILFAGSGAA